MVDEQLILITAAIVELVKKLTGLDGKWVVLVSLLVGGVLAGVKQYAGDFYAENLPVLLTGLVASGAYALTKGAATGAIDRIRNGA